MLPLVDSETLDPNLPTATLTGRSPCSSPKTWREESDSGVGVILKKPALDLEKLNRQLAATEATHFVEWAVKTFEDGLVMSTSFGIHSAVMLHLVSQIVPDISVIWVDTGYLPPETYRFAEHLTKRLRLNVKVYQSPVSSARMEALYGRIWEQDDVEALNRYDQLRKVEPMQRALRELKARAWLSGLRSNQTNYRRTLHRVDRQSGMYKLLPILHWTTRDMHEYLTARGLPYHPSFEQGYVTVGDWHSSRPLTAADECERNTRFRGLKQECGLHLPLTSSNSHFKIS